MASNKVKAKAKKSPQKLVPKTFYPWADWAKDQTTRRYRKETHFFVDAASFMAAAYTYASRHKLIAVCKTIDEKTVDIAFLPKT